ncbi:MAG: hypothetical protein U0Q11_12015 [Vicinamibacterales bacterium]
MSPDIIIAPASFAMVGYITYIVVQAWTRRHRLKVMTDFQNKLLDKLGSVKDFGDFLQTDAGARLMADFGAEPVGISSPKERILRAAQFGAVLGCLGLGLLIFSLTSNAMSGEGHLVANAFGTIALSLGIGFVVSTVASFRLAARMGLLESPRSSHTEIVATRA